MRILIIEDEPAAAAVLGGALLAAGFEVDRRDAARAAALLAADAHDLALVDAGPPREDGHALVAHIRRAGHALPLLVVTGHRAGAFRAAALDLGADDCVHRSVEPVELAARCRALVRRTRAAQSATPTIGALALDLARRTARLAGQPLALTPREWAVLECLALDAGQVVRKERLLRAIAAWDEELSPNALEVYVSRLRAKLGGGVEIRTVRGLGYRLEEPG
jgi:DNA-binding response OmpR family regulator